MVQVLQFDDAEGVAQGTAIGVETRIGELLERQDTVNLVVTGGTVGIMTLAALRKVSIDWSRVHIWWGDERFVNSDSPDRNYVQAENALLMHIDIPESNLHPFPAADEGLTLEDAAVEFAKQVAGVKFDLLLLGVGPDGHVASLFPGHELRGRFVVAEADSPKPPAQRLSFTYDVINSADEVWFTVAGADKADAVFAGLKSNPKDLPVGRVRGVQRTVWFADSAALARLS
jgi:6-phosphogluconolactonase